MDILLNKNEKDFNNYKNTMKDWTSEEWLAYLAKNPESSEDIDDISCAQEPCKVEELSPAQYAWREKKNEEIENAICIRYEREEGINMNGFTTINFTLPRKNSERRKYAVIQSKYMTAKELDKFMESHKPDKFGRPDTGLYTVKEAMFKGWHVMKKEDGTYVEPIAIMPLWAKQTDWGIFNEGKEPVKTYEFSQYALAKKYAEENNLKVRALPAKEDAPLYEKPTRLYAKEQMLEFVEFTPRVTPVQYIENLAEPDEVPFEV